MGDGGRFLLILRGREDLIRGVGGQVCTLGRGQTMLGTAARGTGREGWLTRFKGHQRSSRLQGGECGGRAGGEGGALDEWGGIGGTEGAGLSGR